MNHIEHQKRTLDLIEEIQTLLDRKRLEWGEGCVAATCCEGREADKEQGSAERAKPSGAAHVAPVEADALWKVVNSWSDEADEYQEMIKQYEGHDMPISQVCRRLSAVHSEHAWTLRRLLDRAESRKAKADSPLERFPCYDAQSEGMVSNQKRS